MYMYTYNISILYGVLNYLFIDSDASPGSQLVSEKFQVDWAWYLASTKNFIVAQIDGRGSGFQVF